ncbi:hypothetical protein V3C99_011819, partial [Haemonchus contortus]
DDKAASSTKSKQKVVRSASIYFMEWTSTALAHYTGTLNALYSKPLIEHCTKTKVADDQSSGKTSKSAEMEKLADGTSMTAKDDHDQLVARLREAASRVTQWGSQGEQVMNVKNKEVTLAEMAAMYRLKTLISISANLVELITRVKTWSKENSKLIEKCRTRNVLPMTMNMFEATCAIGEIFKLKSIDRSGTREDFQQFLREQSQNEYTSEANTSLVIGNPRDYIPPLECRINHYRTCVNLIGSSLITIIQTYMNSIPLEQIDIKTREVKEVLERLPSMYMRIQANLSFSDYTTKLIKEYPPNKLQFPLAPQGTATETSKQRSGGTVEKQKPSQGTASENQRQKTGNSEEKVEESGKSPNEGKGKTRQTGSAEN